LHWLMWHAQHSCTILCITWNVVLYGRALDWVWLCGIKTQSN
jgi:hypothetical protein